jgi:hypothetical protein
MYPVVNTDPEQVMDPDPKLALNLNKTHKKLVI